jgi:hypothetical protein
MSLSDPNTLRAIAAAAIFGAGYPFYWIHMARKGQTVSRITWLIWAPLNILMIAAFDEDPLSFKNPAVLLPLVTVIGATLTMVASWFRGTWGWERTEKFCLFAAAISFCALCFLHSHNWAMVFAVIGDASGIVAAIRNELRHRGAESPTTWILWLVGSGFLFFALPARPEVSAVLFSAWFVLASVTMTALTMVPTVRAWMEVLFHTKSENALSN